MITKTSERSDEALKKFWNHENGIGRSGLKEAEAGDVGTTADAGGLAVEAERLIKESLETANAIDEAITVLGQKWRQYRRDVEAIKKCIGPNLQGKPEQVRDILYILDGRVRDQICRRLMGQDLIPRRHLPKDAMNRPVLTTAAALGARFRELNKGDDR